MKFFFVIGAMKSGTSSLFNHLRTHPAIFASKAKEPSFFTEPTPSLERVASYHSLFEGAPGGAWVFEASTNYTKYPRFSGVPKRIHEMYPDARLIYILRHPVDRICSHYIQNLSDGRESRNFEAAVLGDDPHYLNVSRYYLQLRQYLEFFPPERILLLIFEEFLQNRLRTLQRVFEFLDVDPSFVPPNLHEIKNASRDKTVPRTILRGPGPWSWRSGGSPERWKWRATKIPLWNYVPPRFRSFVRQKFRRAAPLKSDLATPVLRNRIAELIADDVSQLQAYLGKEFSCWDLRPAVSTSGRNRSAYSGKQ